MKLVYTEMARREPAKDDEFGPPHHKTLTGGGVGLMMIGTSEPGDAVDESDESDEHVEDVGDDGTTA